MIKPSNSHAVTDNGVIVAKGNKKAMLKLRVELANSKSLPATDREEYIKPLVIDRRYQVYLTYQSIGANLT